VARDYKKIIAWRKSHELTLAVYQHTKRFPAEERFGITSQLRRAAVSVPANIVEGSGRETNKDNLRFLTTALASLKETEYFLMLSRDLQYLGEADYTLLNDMTSNTLRTLQGFIKAVRRELDSGDPTLRTTDYRPQTLK